MTSPRLVWPVGMVDAAAASRKLFPRRVALLRVIEIRRHSPVIPEVFIAHCSSPGCAAGAGRGRRRRLGGEGGFLLAGLCDENGGAERAAEAAPAVVLEEAHADGAADTHLAVPAPAGRHPLRRLQAHGAAAIFFRVVDRTAVGGGLRHPKPVYGA
jgi:hypothetical protein